jgi:TRAP-type C4-dicarboxylate transport system substrate-binding protein
MRLVKASLMVLIFFVACVTSVSALTIKLASIAPENSPWGEALNRVAAEWSRISNGEVELKIYHNGIAGDEANMLRKLKMGQIQAGIFTSFGLMEITPQIMTLSYPFLIRDDKELDYVLDRLLPIMEKSADEKNYVIISYSKAGWIRFFSKNTVVTPDDLKASILVSNPDDPVFSQTWKQLGYHVVPVAIPDVLQSLNSGLINTIWSSPVAVAGYQWFAIANHMTDLKIAPFVGGFVITKSAFQSIPERLRPQLLQTARDITSELDKNISQLEEVVFVIMKNNGLIIHPVPPDAVALWAEEFKRGAALVMGKTFSLETYNQIIDWLNTYRSK